MMTEKDCVSYIIIFLFPNRRKDQMVGFLLLLILLCGGLYFILGLSDIKEIKENWPKHRCKASVMPFASVYGFDTQENFTYCMSNIMTMEAGPLLTPVFQILGTIIGAISIIINTINSFRVQIATMMGGINTIFQNFTDRISQITAKVKVSSQRIKSLMLRLYGIFFAIIYMSVSGFRALNNFSNTFLFKFLDTFCFDPDTPVDIQGRGRIPMRNVRIGDKFINGTRVTGTFEFGADGQPMVRLGDILVSTNHFILHEGKKIRADEHPDALIALPWTGGKENPLICLNTDTHTIPLGGYTFMDYDESDEADDESMKMIEGIVNAGLSVSPKSFSYSNCFASDTEVLMKEGGSKKVSDVKVGDCLTTGIVVGKVQKEVHEICTLPDGKRVGAGILVWHKNAWKRAGDVYPVKTGTTEYFTNVILTPSAVVETVGGACFRDYMELHSHDAEVHYEAALRGSA